jgi:plasmid stabilization system protein ParE
MGKRKIIWSNRATKKLLEILEFYASRNKSKFYSVDLYRRINQKLKVLISQPEIGIKTDSKNVRGLIVGHFILFYEFDKEHIVVHTIWDSRQNPENLKIK